MLSQSAGLMRTLNVVFKSAAFRETFSLKLFESRILIDLLIINIILILSKSLTERLIFL